MSQVLLMSDELKVDEMECLLCLLAGQEEVRCQIFRDRPRLEEQHECCWLQMSPISLHVKHCTTLL